MEGYRPARSTGDGRKEMEGNGGGAAGLASGRPELRCCSTPHAASEQTQQGPKDANFNGEATPGSPSSSQAAWGFSDPELQRRKRVATYKVYAMESKVKGSLRKVFRWLKDRLNGWR